MVIFTLLIVFKYKTDILYGSDKDLEYSYNWSNNLLNYPTKIITDINDEEITLNNFKKELFNLPDNISKLIVYYSGHGINDSILLPDNNLLSFEDFKKYLLSKLHIYTEIFMILDCCNATGLNLPYKLEDNNFRLQKNSLYCITNPFLLITSSVLNENAISTKEDGSGFSKILFKKLTDFSLLNTVSNNNNRNLNRLKKEISSEIKKIYKGYYQTISIYSSYKIDPILWMWIGRKTDISINYDLNSIIIRK